MDRNHLRRAVTAGPPREATAPLLGNPVGIPAAVCLALCVASGLAAVPRASAQPIDPLSRYDLDGTRTLDALRGLRATTPSGARVGSDGGRLRIVRAATDLWLLSFLDPDHDHLGPQLAHAIGVPQDVLATELLNELDRIHAGPRDTIAAELRTAITLAREIGREGTGVSFAGTEGLRRDALIVDAVARAIAFDDHSALVAMVGDPCADLRAEEAPCGEPWSAWSGSSRAVIAAMVEASLAAGRLANAAARGDSFARAVQGTLAEPTRTIASHVEQPVPLVGAELPCGSSVYDDTTPVRADVIVAVGLDAVSVSRVSSVRVVDGMIVPLHTGEDVSPLASVTSIRGDRLGRLQALVTRLHEMELPADATVAVSAADDVPVTLLGRVLMTLEDEHLPPAVLVRRASDGSLRGVNVRVLARSAVSEDGDLFIRTMDSGYVVTSGDNLQIEAPNEEALWHRLTRARGNRVVLDATGHTGVADLYDAAFRLGRGGGTVSVVTP